METPTPEGAGADRHEDQANDSPGCTRSAPNAQQLPEPDLGAAAQFLELLDPDTDGFTFQVFDDSPLKRGNLARVCHGPLDDHAGRLTSWQKSGAGAFVTVNQTDGMGRKAENVTRVRAVFVDLDGAPLGPVLRCSLEPHVVVESSPGRWHAYWIVDGLELDQFGPVQTSIIARFGGDRACVDLPRVMRLPGFIHQKGDPFRTVITHLSDRLPYTAKQILAEFPPAEPKATSTGNGHDADPLAELVRQILSGDSYHAPLCALAWRHLNDGMDPGKVVLTLRGYMDSSTGPRDDRWGARYNEIARTVGTAQEKLERQNESDQTCAISAKSAESHDWPAPLEDAAFYGLAGDVVRAIEPHSEADPAAILLQFLAAFGNACDRTHYMAIEGDRHPAQLWPILVGETAKARKGTSWGRVRQLFEIAVPMWTATRIASGLSSGEGLIWQVRDPIVQRVKNKKTGEYEEEEVDAGVTDKRLFVIEPEFASPLRHMERTGNTLSGTLRCLWDRGDVSALTKNSPARTTGAVVAIVGHVTVEELKRYLTRTEMANGLANRCLFACVRRSKELPFGGAEVDLQDLADRIADRIGRIDARGVERVMWTDPARALWIEVYHDLSEGKPGMVGAVTSRAEAQTLRMALTYALLDGSVYIERAHLEAALAVWRYCDQSAAFLFGTSLGDPVADDIRRALEAAPNGMTRNDIRNLFGRHQSSDAIGRAIDLLLERGLARSEKRSTGGRPEERWFAQ